MDEQFAPRPTGKEPEDVTLTGKVFPWGADEQPVLLSMPKCDDYFLPLFSDPDDLRGLMASAGISFDRIMLVEDGAEFLDSLPVIYAGASLRIIVDPTFTPEGRVRFVEIQRTGLDVGGVLIDLADLVDFAAQCTREGSLN